jgi:hypothetical protein
MENDLESLGTESSKDTFFTAPSGKKYLVYSGKTLTD